MSSPRNPDTLYIVVTDEHGPKPVLLGVYVDTDEDVVRYRGRRVNGEIQVAPEDCVRVIAVEPLPAAVEECGEVPPEVAEHATGSPWNGYPEWLQLIWKANDLRPETFGEPEISEWWAGGTVEEYPDARVIHRGDGTVSVVAKTPEGLDVLSRAAAELGIHTNRPGHYRCAARGEENAAKVEP
jgi:hypothetical protein